jgi:hypothetical protein
VVIATPSAPPIWRAVLLRPDASPDRPLVGRVGRCSAAVLVVGRERAPHLVDDEPRDAGQSLDEDDPRVDRPDLSSQLSLAVQGDLSAEDDQVDPFQIEAAGDVGEVVGRLGLVTEVAEAGDRLVEDESALANQQHAALGVVGCHVSSLSHRAACVRAARSLLSLTAEQIYTVPPFTRMFWPVIQRAPSPAMKATTSAMSATRPRRLNADIRSRLATNSGSLPMR